MENLYKSRSEICLSQVKETLWRTPPLNRRRWKTFFPRAAPKSKWLSLPQLQVSPISLRLMNNNFSSLSSSQLEGDLWLKEGSLFRRPSWNKKRFVLIQDKLYCYENRKGVLVFSGIVMVSDITSLTLHHNDCIKICHSDGRSRLLRCPSEDMRNSWLTALLEAKAANLLKYQ